jgi:predicted small integral membrane protein
MSDPQFGAQIDIMEDEEPVFVGRTGFLPIQTNWFDRCFISVVIWVAISLFWFRFVEPVGLSIWIGNIVSLAFAVYIVRKG